MPNKNKFIPLHQNSSAQLDALNMDKKVSFGQQSTKVKQLSDIIEQDIMMGKYKTDTSLPSINYLSRAYNVYNSFVRKLSTSYKVDLWFHQYNEHIFNTILHEAIGRYNYYVVMNFDNEKFSPLFNKITPSRLLLLDFGKFEKENYSYICQNFDDAFYGALSQLTERLKKYRKIVFHLPVGSKHPQVSAESFRQYCHDNDFISEVSGMEDIDDIESGTVYIVIRQTDVVNIIKRSREKGMKCGQDFGLIAYNDTPAYEVIDDGITALSINWDDMGKKAAKFILSGETIREYLPTEVHLRNSV